MLAGEFSAMLGDIDAAQKEIVALSEAKLATRTEQLDVALNNMSHGLCMFDEQQALACVRPSFAAGEEH